jgi:hypothetical protein
MPNYHLAKLRLEIIKRLTLQAALLDLYSPRSGFARQQDSTRITTAATAKILAISSKEGAVIGTVLGTRKFHH